MKKVLSFLVLIFLFFGIGGSVFAEEECSYEKVSNDLIFDCSFMYFDDYKTFVFEAKKDWKNIIVKNKREIWGGIWWYYGSELYMR